MDRASDREYVKMQYRTFGRTGWQVSEIGYGMWGMAGWTGSDDEESPAVARSRGGAGLQLLRHRVGLWRRPQRAAARRAAEAPPRQTPLHGDEDSAEEPQVAGARRVSAAGRLPGRLHPRVHREEPAQHRRRRPWTCSSSTSGTTRGRQTTSGSARSSDLKREGPGPGHRHQHQPLAAGERPEGARDRSDRLPSRSSTTSSTRRRRTSCSPSASAATSR